MFASWDLEHICLSGHLEGNCQKKKRKVKTKLLNREAIKKLLLANVDECIPLETYKARINHMIFVYVYMTFFQ